ncbi:MAG: ThuA domain-containing protein, partial [Akkermansiaceae bacterium]|nr:ThuA domain-containing protein [Akkermansiaceae bacterium]
MAGHRSHGYGQHEHRAGCLLLAGQLNKHMGDQVEATVHLAKDWPGNAEVLKDADAIVFYCDGGGGHMANKHLDGLDVKLKDGCGLACLHYAVETPKGKSGSKFLEWMGGYFEGHWSVNPHWDADFKTLPTHPITRGVKPFKIRDEWYFHMRFVPGMKGVTPILSAHPPKETMRRRDGHHSGNPNVRAALERGEIQHVAWAYERPNGGRGFGFTGGHFHQNWGHDD